MTVFELILIKTLD